MLCTSTYTFLIIKLNVNFQKDPSWNCEREEQHWITLEVRISQKQNHLGILGPCFVPLHHSWKVSSRGPGYLHFSTSGCMPKRICLCLIQNSCINLPNVVFWVACTRMVRSLIPILTQSSAFLQRMLWQVCNPKSHRAGILCITGLFTTDFFGMERFCILDKELPTYTSWRCPSMIHSIRILIGAAATIHHWKETKM